MSKTVKVYPKGDVRRLFVIASAISELGSPTLVQLAAFTGHNKGTIPTDINKLREQLGVEIEKDGAKYKLISWGDKLKQRGVKNDLRG
jgi:biotin operon repressor